MNTRKTEPILLDNQTDLVITSSVFTTVLDILREEEKISKDAFLVLKLSNDGSIRDLNRKYLGRNTLTDVISFQADMHGIPLLGDIIIDINVADGQKENRTLEEELQVLFLHGLLHLLGYDHLGVEQSKEMKIKEKKYYSKLKEKHITRGR
ncbi:MAG: rRNA maturation RNase YbeY [Candidatus Cloacimonetes bacterium]|nr:rRNA maturation RNase YbeY [Candidatus Cloacimonadota bacterium]